MLKKTKICFLYVQSVDRSTWKDPLWDRSGVVYHLAALLVDPTGPQVGLPTNNNLDNSITSWYVHS